MISEASIRAAMRAAPRAGKSVIELKDDGARGEGRLAMIVRVGSKRVSTEWYAVWYVSGRRRMTKIGSYPTLSLAEARKSFRETYAPSISKGEEPVRPRKRREAGSTVQDLFTAYCDDLDAQGKSSVVPRKCLIGSAKPGTGRWGAGNGVFGAAHAIGAGRRAGEIRPKDIIPHLKTIHDRGAIGAAASTRAYISAAFSFAMRSANSYSSVGGGLDWDISFNPVTAIPIDRTAKKVGSRHLTQAEFRHLWSWLSSNQSSSAPVLMSMMATGQRLTEIICLSDNEATAEAYAANGVRLGVIDWQEKTLDWAKTKNNRPHTIPLPKQAADALAAVPVTVAGVLFPHRDRDGRLMTISGPEQLIKHYLRDNPTVAYFTPRDLRRTWKTLSGAAGITKEIRDRLQNHAKSDISSRHYDRYDYLAEKRSAMTVWEAYLDRILEGQINTQVASIIGETPPM
jgi:integrase